MQNFEKDMEMTRRIAENVASAGGRAYFVGGYVRDKLLGIENKDIDIEIHGIYPAQLESILDSLGGRTSMGESFGIYGLKGYGIDIAMPRKEKALGRGHRDFQMSVDPFIGTYGAALRRDFTINALMMDVISEEIVDHFGGISDLGNGILRHVNDQTFAEDALRVLRGAQFAARFHCTVAEETVLLCRNIRLDSLSKERIEGELRKALLKAEKPSEFFATLREMNRLDEWFPELKALIGVEQNPKYHAEGDVWVHTMMVLDEAAKLRENTANPFGFMLTALSHDYGKAICTEKINGVIHSYEHEIKGLPLIEAFLCRITNETKLQKYVLNMAKLHMRPNTLAAQRSSVKSTNKMFDLSVAPRDLIYMSIADHLGRITSHGNISYEDFLFERLSVYEETMKRPYVMGRDLVKAGLVPDEYFSELLSYAHKLRLAGVEKASALKQTLSYAQTKKRK